MYLAKKVHYGLNPEDGTDEISYDTLDDFLNNQYGISIDDFEDLINDLLPLCDKAQSAITETWYRGFGTGSFWLYKEKC